MKILSLVLLLAVAAVPAMAADSLSVAPPEVRAYRLAGPIRIDGLLDEAAWRVEPARARFVQADPDQGAPPSFPTEVWILYDDDAIYFGARMRDAAPDSIVARLARRDQGSRSDEITLYLDPYHDRRSGYYFAVSAASTLRDGVYYNDSWSDDSWDGVWQGRAHVDSSGWTAEMRIPYSQLRFRKSEHYRWGVNFGRTLARRNEESLVAYTPRNESGFFSRFPDLTGIESVSPSRAIQITPYVTTRGEFLGHVAGDPFNDGSRYVPAMGADLKTAVGSKLTLNAAFNPDFGQVEVDPAVVNLSDVETFFPEKRPFFVEGSSNYEFGFGGANNYMGFNWPGPTFFYSRRVGRAPEGGGYAYDYHDVPRGTSILGAGKLTGKVLGDWNLGLMQAVTAREFADLELGGLRGRAEVEPLASYSVLRTQREFDKGRHGLGSITTFGARDFKDPALKDQLNSSSLAAGLDGWTFLDRDRKWVLTGWGGMTDVRGSVSRITDLQTGSTHYLQRPDAERWRLDPDATSLTGYAGRLALNKQKGRHTFNTAVGFIDPHFDTNDLGYLSRADVLNLHVSSGYRWSDPNTWRRSADFTAATYLVGDYDGNRTGSGLWMNGGVVFLNYWALFGGFEASPRNINNRLTRGGPLTESPPRYSGWVFADTDGRRPLYYSAEVDFARSRSGGWDIAFYPGVQWKPAPNIALNFNPGFDRNHQDSQYVGVVDDPGATETFGRRYVFAQLDQTTLSASIRLNWAFTPNLSLQVYGQPLISTGNYFAYKQLLRPRSYTWEPVGSGVPQYDFASDQIDLDGAGPNAPRNPDFNFTSLRGNAVLRWEYMPGSTLFLVWTQDRTGNENVGEFRLGPACSQLVDQRPDNIFLAKVTYYLTR